MTQDVEYLHNVFLEFCNGEINKETSRKLITFLLKDKYIFEHSKKVTYYSITILRAIKNKFNLTSEDEKDLFISSLFHDIGKLKIPDKILYKPSRLSNEEFEVMKKHSILSVELLKKFHIFKKVLKYITHHHERYDCYS